MSDEGTVIFEKSDPPAVPDEPVSPYYVVQVWRPSEDLALVSAQGANPCWVNQMSSHDRAEAERYYFKAASENARVRLIEVDQVVADV